MKLRRVHLGWFTLAAAMAALGVQCDWCCKPPPPTCDAPGPSPDPAALPLSTTPLQGFVDLHTHPMSNLGFAGKLVYGGIDEGSVLPQDPDCHVNVDAGSACQALGHCGSTHAGIMQGVSCGDEWREALVTGLQAANTANVTDPDAKGFPDFDQWPKWNDISHQVMWVDWIKRAYLGGLRVMVALAVNNKTLADVAQDGDNDALHPDDDKGSADQQILRIKEFVNRHSDWMGVAYQADDVQSLLQQNKLAVVLGVEIDNIGDFNEAQNLPDGPMAGAVVHAEIQRLHEEGVRYVFPIHVLDNAFGTAAYYEDLFNLSNFLEAKHFMNLECSDPTDEIDQLPDWCGPLYELSDPLRQVSAKTRLASIPVQFFALAEEAASPICPQCGSVPTANGGTRPIGYVNRGADFPGLKPIGKFAILDMMRQGMLIDVDHMSEASTNDTLALALQEQYPVNSGHNFVRVGGGSERNLAPSAYATIGKLHGMAGVGLAKLDQVDFVSKYQQVLQALEGPDAGGANSGGTEPVAGIGTDADGVSSLVKAPPSTMPPLAYDDAAGNPKSCLGNKCWDYNTDGVAHYGMLADLLRALPNSDGGAAVQQNLMKGAQYFYDTWKLAEAYAAAHAGDAGVVVAADRVSPRQSSMGCNAPRFIDDWGVCVSNISQPPAPRTEPPIEAATDDTVLESGAYALHLETNRDPRGVHAVRVQDFAVEVVAAGRALTVRNSGVDGSGGFGRDRYFLMRIRVGAQRVGLLAFAPQEGKLDEVHGAFVAYAPGATATRGRFRLYRATTTADAHTLGVPLVALPSFIESLRE